MIGAPVLRELNSERERAQNPAAGKKNIPEAGLGRPGPQKFDR